MIYLIVIAFVIIIVAFYGNPGRNDLDYTTDQAAIIAKQMVYYHSAAAKKCASTCTGAIDPTSELTQTRQGAGVFANGTFKSLVSGDYIVTYYDHRLDEDLSDEFSARIAAAVPQFMERDTAFWAGPYDQSTGRIAFRAPSMWRDPDTNELHQAFPELIDINIPAIDDGAPVIANRK